MICAPTTGYLVSVDGDALLACAERQSAVVAILPSIGDFVVKGLPMLHAQRGAAWSGRASGRDSVGGMLLVTLFSAGFGSPRPRWWNLGAELEPEAVCRRDRSWPPSLDSALAA